MRSKNISFKLVFQQLGQKYLSWAINEKNGDYF